jgi:hypothetical protein
MTQETVIYLTNTIIVVILATLITQHWLVQGRTAPMRAWMVAAWVMVVADVFFAARPALPEWMGRIIPTLLVTVGQVALLVAARRTAELRSSRLLMAGVVVLHAAVLVGFFALEPGSEWRKVANGLVWAGLSFAAYGALRKASSPYWRSVQSPATAFLLHGVFHCMRTALASVFSLYQLDEADAWLQTIGNLEVSFFMVALFVSILVSNLQLRNEELSRALADVNALSALLPICAWCKKVRNDDGYWQRVEDYLSTHSQIKFTHGICADCYKEHDPNKPHEHGSKT